MVGQDNDPAQREGEGGRAPTGAVVAKDEAPVPLRYADLVHSDLLDPSHILKIQQLGSRS